MLVPFPLFFLLCGADDGSRTLGRVALCLVSYICVLVPRSPFA